MLTHRSTLPSGLRILSTQTPSDTVTLLVLVGAGSRYETKEINGISHFIEHMFFKGAKKYKNTKEVSEAIDAVGGVFNAFTGKEYAGYYVKLAKEQKEVAFTVVSDMLLHAKFDPAEIDKERGVILEEYNMYQDTPMYQIGWDFEKIVFGGNHPLGWDQVGTKELIKSVTQEQFQNYFKELYSADNTVISVAGNITHEEAAKLAEKYFDFTNLKSSRDWAEFNGYSSEPRVIVQNKKTEQSHVVVGYPGYHTNHPDYYAEKVLACLLGGNMSSRMFLNIREAHGLCYYINTSTDGYTDCGTISTGAGVTVEKADHAVQSIIAEYENLKKEDAKSLEEKNGNGFSELEKTKNCLIGKLAISLEDTEEVAHMVGKQEILREKSKSVDDIKKAINAVTAQDIIRVANDLFDEKKLYIAYIGPEASTERFEKLLS